MVPVPRRYAGVYPPVPSAEARLTASATRSRSWETRWATVPPLLIGNWNSIHPAALSRNVSALSSRVSDSPVSPSVAVDIDLIISPSPRLTYTVMSSTASSAESMSSDTLPESLSAIQCP